MNFIIILLFMNFIMIYKFKNNFLMILISMEFIVINILMMIFLYEYMNFNQWLFLFYMIFSVCESVIGLTIMVNLIYLYGNQNITMLNLLW